MAMQPHKIVRAAGVVGSATLLSRILGYVRDMVIAYFFGTADAADAFFVAFRIPNLFRRLLSKTDRFKKDATKLVKQDGKFVPEGNKYLQESRDIVDDIITQLSGKRKPGTLPDIAYTNKTMGGAQPAMDGITCVVAILGV